MKPESEEVLSNQFDLGDFKFQRGSGLIVKKNAADEQHLSAANRAKALFVPAFLHYAFAKITCCRLRKSQLGECYTAREVRSYSRHKAKP